jgi:hypothetical protein
MAMDYFGKFSKRKRRRSYDSANGTVKATW